jgi:hypothetical protein
MSKRYYISKAEIIDGDDGREVRLKASQYGRVLAANVPLAQDGSLIDSWALCVVEADDHVGLVKDPDIIVLPVYALDAKVSAMHTATRTALVNRLKARGIPTDFIGNADGFREVIRTIGRLHNPGFDEDSGSWAL